MYFGLVFNLNQEKDQSVFIKEGLLHIFDDLLLIIDINTIAKHISN